MTTTSPQTSPSRFVNVLGSTLHYIEQGSGDPILFLHGMPTSSYLWRNILPPLAELGRCIAVDLIGMGQSGKPDIAYTLEDHIRYIEAFINALQLENMTLVMHGWGSVIGLHYAMTQEANCKGLVFYEAYLRPLNGDDISLPYLEQIALLDAQENRNEQVLNSTYFVDKTLPQSMLHTLTDDERAHYRAPFLTKGAGKPLLQFLQDMPRLHGKGSADRFIAAYSKKLTQSPLPKLLLYSMPGFITTMATVMWAKEQLPQIEIADVGEELHYAQESNPQLMAETISVWLQGLED